MQEAREFEVLKGKPRSEGVRKKDERRKTEGGKESQRSVSAWGSIWSEVTWEEFLLMERQRNLEHKLSNIQLNSLLRSTPLTLSVVSPVHTDFLALFGSMFKRKSRKGSKYGFL